MLFSERNNHLPLPVNLKSDEISESLRNSLWNEVTEWLELQTLEDICNSIWKSFFKQPVDAIPYSSNITHTSYLPAWKEVRKFYFSCPWHKVYSFLEFLMEIDKHGNLDKKLDRVLISELAAYRVMNKQFTQITDKNEIMALSEGLTHQGAYAPVSTHIQSSLNLLSNRDNPDYRNSIKESISAVEAVAKIITKSPNATLADALKVLESRHKLHPALKKAYSSLYGYANDSNGIRHALMENSDLSQADAKYFLLSCTSFTNYLITVCER